MSEHAKAYFLDVDFEVARSLHRVVRAMHDGECPSCHRLFDARAMMTAQGRLNVSIAAGHRCPHCGFTITAEESIAAIAAFAPVMKKNLEVFESWRARRNNNPPAATLRL
jgi:hypothetical protein